MAVFNFNLSTIEAEKTEIFNSPEAFTEHIYNNYAQNNFSEVYQKFAPELKRILKEEEYLDFQKENFEKYNLEYSEIEVETAKSINFEEIKKQFSYAEEFGEFYELSVSYLIRFKRMGRRERQSDKKVYLRKINAQYQLFWDPETIEEDPEEKADNND